MNAKEIASALIRNVVQTPDTGAPNSAVNAALAKLRTRVEHKLVKLEGRLSKGKGLKDKWTGVIDVWKTGHEIMPMFQVQVCKWSDFRKGKTARLVYNTGIAKTGDSSGGLQAPLGSRTIYPADAQLGACANAYFHELFCANGAPLKGIGDMLDELDGQFWRLYDVTLSIDYYYTRPLTALGLHKDTTGNTLFVGLHYNNEQDMVGPEWMYDFWPSFDQRAYSPHHDDHGTHFWPKSLRDGLELARGYLKDQNEDTQDVLYVTEMSPNGLIAFVDELVFHQTPLTRYRKADEAGERVAGYNKFNIDLIKAIGPKRLTLDGPPRLRRQFSEKKMEAYWADRGTGGQSGRRSFVRFWAMVEPVQWFAR